VQFDVRSNIADVGRWMSDAQKRQIPFATVLALTMTAKDARTEEVSVMKRVFDRPTPYTLNALRVKPATKSTMIASVEFRDSGGGTPAKRFLNPEVHGGPRSQRSSERLLEPYMAGFKHFMPGRDATPNQYGNLSANFYKRVVSQLRSSSDPLQNATGSKRSKKHRSASAFFVPQSRDAVYERRGKSVKPVLVFTKVPRYRVRFPFEATAAKVVAARFGVNWINAFERAMASSNVKGKWRS